MTEQEVLQIFAKTGAIITDSHIVYTSGKHGSAYMNKDAIYPHTKETSKLCREIAKAYQWTTIEVVIAPAIGGTILSQWVAYHLSELNLREVLALYAEREERSVVAVEGGQPVNYQLLTADSEARSVTFLPGEEIVLKKKSFTLKRGYDTLLAGKRTLVVEDVLTTGGSARKVVELVREKGGILVGVGVLCNRGGVTTHDLGLSLSEAFLALASVTMNAYEEAECPLCLQGVPINTEVGKGKAFLERKAAG